MKRLSLIFTSPGQVEVVEEALPPLRPGTAIVRTIVSAISPGTERLIYRGQAPANMSLDETLPDLDGSFRYPFRYGYSLIGRVIELGPGVPPDWQDTMVFGFLPHQSYAVCEIERLRRLPAGLSPDSVLFLPNLESAVNFMMDGRPVIGERIVVFGQGVLGLLTTALLAQSPLSALVTVDLHAMRRKASVALGAHASLDAALPDLAGQIVHQMGSEADLVFELSGRPEVLDEAIRVAGFESRIVVGSWYGERRAGLDLGGRFHRNRLQLISSQVSTIGTRFAGRWDKERRLRLAETLLQRIKPEQLITHRLPFTEAADAYRLLDAQPDQYIQIVLVYD